MLVLRKQRFMGLFLEKEDLTLKNPMIFMVRGSLCNLFYFILFLLWKIWKDFKKQSSWIFIFERKSLDSEKNPMIFFMKRSISFSKFAFDFFWKKFQHSKRKRLKSFFFFFNIIFGKKKTFLRKRAFFLKERFKWKT